MVSREVMHKGLNLIHSPGMLSLAEADFLYDLAAGVKPPVKGESWVRWVELGVWCGRSLWAAGCGLPDWSFLVGIDQFTGELPRREGSEEILKFAPPELQKKMAYAVAFALKDMRPDRHCATIETGDSSAMAVGFLSDSTDVLVVDAAHDYASVRGDLEAWLPKMRAGSVIVGHDYGGRFAGVTRAFDEMFGGKCQKIDGTRFVKVQL
jgi:hypothetical protein